MNIAHRIARLAAAFASVAACALAAPALAVERIPQVAENGAYTRQIDTDDGTASASPDRICEPGAKWIRLGFKDLVLKGYDSLTISGDDGSSYTFEGDHWSGLSFSARAIEGECVSIKAYFADADSHYAIDGYQYGTEPLDDSTYVVVGAGDICTSPGTTCMATSDTVIGIDPVVVLTAGDNTYENGALSEFTSMYDPSWGRFKSIIEPAPGNHEYTTSGATGYFDYFNGAGVQVGQAGDRSKGYYSWNIGSWHFIALNSSSGSNPNGPDGNELTWLQADLAANTQPCVAAYWHHPIASNGNYHPGIAAFKPWWDALYAAHADLVINGHDHNYQRYPSMTNTQTSDPVNGIVEVLVGTGGRGFYARASSNLPPLAPVASNYSTWGVLKMTLSATGYQADFVPVSGSTYTDSFSGTCHMAPHHVSGTVTGLAGSGLVLQLNGGGDLAVAGNGSFTFDGTLSYGDTYAITVAQQPTQPAQICSVTNDGSGTVAGADIGDVAVNCVTRTWNVATHATGPGTIDPPSAVVSDGQTQAFTLTASTGYHIGAATGCNGTLSGSTYTTGGVTADCTVEATFAIDTFALTYTAAAHGSIGGEASQTVAYGADGSAVTALPDTGYHFVQWSDGSTANPRVDVDVTADLSVTASFEIDTYTVDATVQDGHGSITPPSQVVNYGDTATFALAPDTGYHVESVTGCGGTLNGTTYTTGAITGDCAVQAHFAIDTHTVGSRVVAGNGTISPPTQTVDYGATATFMLMPAVGNHIDSATGCGGTLTGSTYTTGEVTADCTVDVAFALDQVEVTAEVDGGHGTISPDTQTLSYGSPAVFTLTPDPGYAIDVIGGTCPAGTQTGDTYVIDAVTADCSLVVSFAVNAGETIFSSGFDP